MIYDVAVAGLGAYGAASLYQAANSGLSAIGFDPHTPPHGMGSSHGETRVTRLAIGEGAHLSPVVRRSHALWGQIEAESGTAIYTRTGGLFISSARRKSDVHVANFFANTIAAAMAHHVPHEILDAKAMRARFPQFAVHDDEAGYYEPDAGFVRPEIAIGAQLRLAAAKGAVLRCGEAATGWRADAGGVAVRTAQGEVRARRLILCAGAYLPGLIGERIAPLLTVLRQTLHWYAIKAGAAGFCAPAMPVFIWELPTGPRGLYGFPSLDGKSLKIASEDMQAVTTAQTVDRQPDPGHGAELWREAIAAHIPGLSPEPVMSAVCLYTMTPDAGFIIDAHPDCEKVLIVSACSGHGFKHSAALGEVIAGWAREGHFPDGYEAFRLKRFHA